MGIIWIAVCCFLAASAGYGAGFMLNRWENVHTQDSVDQANRFVIFVGMIGVNIFLLFGGVWLLLELEILAFILSIAFAVLGFRVGHPYSAARLRALLRYISGFTEILGLTDRMRRKRLRTEEEEDG